MADCILLSLSYVEMTLWGMYYAKNLGAAIYLEAFVFEMILKNYVIMSHRYPIHHQPTGILVGVRVQELPALA